jgi:hypothetical protein
MIIHLRLRGKLVKVQHGPATVSEKEGYIYPLCFINMGRDSQPMNRKSGDLPIMFFKLPRGKECLKCR